MGIKDELNKAVKNVQDGFKEAGHRGEAQAEQTKRDVAGDQMTASEKAGSMANQAKNTVEAEFDKAKQDVRNNT